MCADRPADDGSADRCECSGFGGVPLAGLSSALLACRRDHLPLGERLCNAPGTSAGWNGPQCALHRFACDALSLTSRFPLCAPLGGDGALDSQTPSAVSPTFPSRPLPRLAQSLADGHCIWCAIVPAAAEAGSPYVPVSSAIAAISDLRTSEVGSAQERGDKELFLSIRARLAAYKKGRWGFWEDGEEWDDATLLREGMPELEGVVSGDWVQGEQGDWPEGTGVGEWHRMIGGCVAAVPSRRQGQGRKRDGRDDVEAQVMFACLYACLHAPQQRPLRLSRWLLTPIHCLPRLWCLACHPAFPLPASLRPGPGPLAQRRSVS